MINNKKIVGFVLVALASIAWGIMPIFAKKLTISGMSTYTVLFYRFSFAAISLFFIAKIRNNSFSINPKVAIYMLPTGIIGYCMTGVFLYTSYLYAPVGIATMLHFIYPALVGVFMLVFFKEKFHLYKLLSILFALSGLFFLSGMFTMQIKLPGIIYAVASGFTFAYYIISISKGRISLLPPIVLTFYLSLIASAFMLIAALVKGETITGFTSAHFLDILVISQVSTVFAILAFLKGIRAIGITNASVLNIIEPVVSVAMGALIFGEALTPNVLVGCAFIIASIFIVALFSK